MLERERENYQVQIHNLAFIACTIPRPYEGSEQGCRTSNFATAVEYMFVIIIDKQILNLIILFRSRQLLQPLK